MPIIRPHNNSDNNNGRFVRKKSVSVSGQASNVYFTQMGNITYGKSKTVHSGNHTYNHTYDMNDSTEESFCCCCFSLPKNEVNCLLPARSTACGETPCGNIHIRGLGPGKQG